MTEWPQQSEFWTTLATALFRQGKWQEALGSADQALKLARIGKTQIHLIQSMCNVRLDRIDQATLLLEQAAEAWEHEEGYDDALTYDNDQLFEEAESLLDEMKVD